MTDELNVGDVVTLRSGGPKMTIERVNADEQQAWCIWFDEGKPQHASFLLTTLAKAPPPGRRVKEQPPPAE